MPDSDGEARLGIFWFVGPSDGFSRLVEHSQPAREVPLIGGFRTLEIGHLDHWRAVVRKDRALSGVPYEAYPRGRANYRAEDDAWILLIDATLQSPPFIDLLVKKWGLPRERLVILDDPHYRCARRVGPPAAAEGGA